MTPFGGSRARRTSNGSYTSSNGGAGTGVAPSSCGRATPNLRLRRNSGGGGAARRSSFSRMSTGSGSGAPDAGADFDGNSNSKNSSVACTAVSSPATASTLPWSSSHASSPGLKTPRSSAGSRPGHFSRVRRTSPVKLDSSSSPTGGGGGAMASGSRSPK